MTGFFVSDGIFRTRLVFTAEDADGYGRLDQSAVLWQMQEIAGAHYEALDLGEAFIRSHGCFWAVTRNELEIDAPVPLGAEVVLDTWSGRFGHGLYRRHYQLLSHSGQIYERGVSTWVLMDIETRQLARDRSWLPDPHVVSRPEELAGARSVLFPPLQSALPRTVQSSETDRNGHMNNTVYLRWANDLLPDSFASGHTMRTLWLEYKKELLLGQTARLEYTIDRQTLFLRGTAEGRDSFLMRCEYDPI